MSVKWTDKMFQSGMLCDVHIGYWTGLKKLQPSDLGLEPGDVPENLYSLGRKKLLPKETLGGFKNIESVARRIVRVHGFQFITGGARFIPTAFIKTVDDQLRELKQTRYMTEVRDFPDKYRDGRREMMSTWQDQLTLSGTSASNSLLDWSVLTNRMSSTMKKWRLPDRLMSSTTPSTGRCRRLLP